MRIKSSVPPRIPDRTSSRLAFGDLSADDICGPAQTRAQGAAAPRATRFLVPPPPPPPWPRRAAARSAARLVPDPAPVPPSDTGRGMCDRLAQAISICGPAPAPAAAAVTCSALDRQVAATLRQAGDIQRASEHDALWQRLACDPRDVSARQQLAAIYAATMRVKDVSPHDRTSLPQCLGVGLRALELDNASWLVHEQLAIAYSKLGNHHLREAVYHCDRAAALCGLASLAPAPAAKKRRPARPRHQPSPDFYRAYWRTFRSFPSRHPQTQEALAIYCSAPLAQHTARGDDG